MLPFPLQKSQQIRHLLFVDLLVEAGGHGRGRRGGDRGNVGAGEGVRLGLVAHGDRRRRLVGDDAGHRAAALAFDRPELVADVDTGCSLT